MIRGFRPQGRRRVGDPISVDDQVNRRDQPDIVDVTAPAFDRLLPVGSVSFGLLALFVEDAPVWVKYTAAAIGLVLAVAWLFSKVGWIGKAIKSRLVRPKISRDQAVRLSVLLDETSNHMSYSYTLSPFHVWHICSNDYSGKVRMNYAYHRAIQSWLHSLNGLLSDPRSNAFLFLDLLSKAIVEAAKVAEQAERDLNDFLHEEQVSDDCRKRIQKDWDAARTHFNGWIDKWQTLFREIDKSVKTGGAHHVRPLGMIG